jgi:hypothetical protein
MKMKIEWYQNNLKNIKDHLERELKQLEYQQDNVNRIKNSIEILEEQIKKAIILGKTEFDADKFNKPRGKK